MNVNCVFVVVVKYNLNLKFDALTCFTPPDVINNMFFVFLFYFFFKLLFTLMNKMI